MDRRNLTQYPPRKEGERLGARSDQYWKYHRARGHLTDSCRELKKEIEKLIQRGKLKEFVADEWGRGRSRSPRREAKPAPVNKAASRSERGKVISVIHGGFAAGGDSTAAREVYASQVPTPVALGKRARQWSKLEEIEISFTGDDLSHVSLPHEDALVVSLLVGGFEMKRIPIDVGSSSDILFEDALEALGKTRKDLRPADLPLVGFSGSTSYPLGLITAPVQFGEGPRSLRKEVTFVVVEASGAYNAILGRTTLNSLGIVASTRHQKMKFPTEHGGGEILGDQVASRKCYVNACRRRNRETMMTWRAVASPSGEDDGRSPTKRSREGQSDGPQE